MQPRRLSQVVLGLRVMLWSVLAVLCLGLYGPAVAQNAGQTLRVGAYEFTPSRGNPYNAAPGVPHIYFWSPIFDGLTWVGETGSATPELALSWQNTGPTSWRMQLRPNVAFSNGESFTAEAIEAIFDWFASDEGKSSSAARAFQYITAVKAVDSHTVEFTTSSPRPIFPNQVAGLFVVPPKAWRDLGVTRFTASPVGSGSYKVTEWTGESFKLTASDSSWRPPRIRQIEYVRLVELATRVQALISNQVDIAILVEAENIRAIEAAGAQVHVVPSPLVLTLGLVLDNVPPGVDVTPLRDKRVRQALNHAVDKETINRLLLGGHFTVASQLSVPIAFGYNPALKPYAYDPAKAKQLLAEAGYPNGFRFVTEVRPEFQDVWLRMSQDLKAVGVDMEVVPIAFADWLQKFNTVKWAGAAFNLQMSVAPEIDSIRVMLTQSCRRQPSYYCNRDMMPLADRIDAEFDVNRRKELLHQLMSELRDEAPVVYLFELKDFNAHSKRVKGFRNVNRKIQFHEMTLE